MLPTFAGEGAGCDDGGRVQPSDAGGVAGANGQPCPAGLRFWTVAPEAMVTFAFVPAPRLVTSIAAMVALPALTVPPATVIEVLPELVVLDADQIGR